uniref:Calpain catalytic domain-containing protein n=1 Tax=Labrus bergylta TaxID=56723 RepID=A0A3Q3G0I4_9LABR
NLFFEEKNMHKLIKFLNQDFQQLKQCCLIRRVRFVDDMFPPDRNSIGEGLLSSTGMARVVWLRPGKLVPNPSFTVDGVSRFDFGQGLVGKKCTSLIIIIVSSCTVDIRNMCFALLALLEF